MKTMRSCARTERPCHSACDRARADGHASGRSNGIRLSDRALMNVLPVAADKQDGLWDRAWGNGTLTAIPAPQRARAQTQTSLRGLRRLDSPDFKLLIADFDQAWPGVTRSRDLIESVQEA